MKKFNSSIFTLLIINMLWIIQATAQKTILLTEKPGTFKFQKEPLNGQGPDSYGKNCACTKAESDAMLVKLEDLVNVYRKTPVLAENKGFDGSCRFYGGRCNSKSGYPAPANIKFWFRSWSLYQGQERQWVSEPPQWVVEINQLDKFRDNSLGAGGYSNTSNPTNPAYSEKALNEANNALNELFYQPASKEVIKPGIDRYGDYVVIYNPDRPPYWEPVTVRETFQLLLNYWKCVPDKADVDLMLPIFEQEFASFSEAEKDSYAYFGSPETISRIGSGPNESPVVRRNLAYWNRNLPKSSVQFMVLEVFRPEISKSKMEKCLKNADGYYYVYRLMKELELEKLLLCIDR